MERVLLQQSYNARERFIGTYSQNIQAEIIGYIIRLARVFIGFIIGQGIIDVSEWFPRVKQNRPR